MSAPTSAYTMELRFLLCPSCGAPTDVPPAGGLARCKFCNVQSHVAARAKHPAFAPPPAPRMSEAERHNRLIAQVGQRLEPPPRIAPLFARGSNTSSWKREDVMAAWQSARKRCAEQGTDAHEAAAELVFLTMVLGNAYLEQKDWTGHRAMLESAFEAFFLPRHRSSIAADLSCGAGRQDDLVGAASWLALCDPYSEDLHADSSYRFARAALARRKGDWRDVLAALGSRTGEVPIHDALLSTCTVTRAHALENLGAVDVAARELDDRMGVSPGMRRGVALMARLYSLCPRSFPLAHASVRQRASLIAAKATGGEERHGLGAIFGARSSEAAARAENACRLAIEGRDALGTVLSVTDTGTVLDDVPLWRLDVRVEIEGVAPFDGAVELLLTRENAATFQGSTIFLLADPRDPRNIASEAIAGPVA